MNILFYFLILTSFASCYATEQTLTKQNKVLKKEILFKQQKSPSSVPLITKNRKKLAWLISAIAIVAPLLFLTFIYLTLNTSRDKQERLDRKNQEKIDNNDQEKLNKNNQKRLEQEKPPVKKRANPSLLHSFIQSSFQKSKPFPATIYDQELPSYTKRKKFIEFQAHKDQWIADQLATTGLIRIEEGKLNKCLFLSIAPQLATEDLQQLPEEWKKQPVLQEWLTNLPKESSNLPPKARAKMKLNWDKTALGKKNIQRADFLRNLAMAFEKELVAYITANETVHLQDPKIQDYIHALYQDMQEELEGLGIDNFSIRLHNLIQTKTIHQKWEYCKTNYLPYYTRTSSLGNFAGLPEALALAYLFDRPLEIYGNNYAATTYTGVKKKNHGSSHYHLLPFYHKPTGQGTPIRLLQSIIGGGHYQRLAKAKK